MRDSSRAGDEELGGLRCVLGYSMRQQQRERGTEELNQGLCKSPLYRGQPRVGRDKSYDASARTSTK